MSSEIHRPRFDMRVKHESSTARVELHGELDLSCEKRFGSTVGAIDTKRLVLDLRGLSFIDSTGLRMILRTWQRSRKEGFTLEVVRGSEQVDRVFRITGVDERLPMVDQASTNGDSPA